MTLLLSQHFLTLSAQSLDSYHCFSFAWIWNFFKGYLRMLTEEINMLSVNHIRLVQDQCTYLYASRRGVNFEKGNVDPHPGLDLLTLATSLLIPADE